MKISSINTKYYNNYDNTKKFKNDYTNQTIQKNNYDTLPPKYSISFNGTIEPIKPRFIEKNIKDQFGIKTNFNNSPVVAKCTEMTILLYKRLFGSWALPKEVEFTSFNNLKKYFKEDETTDTIQGFYDEKENKIFFNSDMDCFESFKNLKYAEYFAKENNQNATSHYLGTFVHEFAHSAHYKHLSIHNREHVMKELLNTELSDLHKFLVAFKLGSYAATNMAEFMAERITKDMCSKLDKNCEYKGKLSNLDYDNIYTNRYPIPWPTPQALLDFFTQQVWNGCPIEAKSSMDKMKLCVCTLERTLEPIVKYKSMLKNYVNILSEETMFDEYVNLQKNTEAKKYIKNSKLLNRSVLLDIAKMVLEIEDKMKNLTPEILNDSKKNNFEFLNEYIENLNYYEKKILKDDCEAIKKITKEKYKEDIFINAFDLNLLQYQINKEIETNRNYEIKQSLVVKKAKKTPSISLKTVFETISDILIPKRKDEDKILKL